MLSIMLHIIYHVASDFLVPIRGYSSNTLVNPSVVFQELTHLYYFGIWPFGVPILLI
jgi:hypothetical protein